MYNLHEYDVVRHGAGLVDRSGRGRIVLHGRDRKTFLHALLTNDIAALAAGSGCYAALLNAQGRMQADMHVFELGEVTFLDAHLEDKDALLTKFDQLIFSEDVQLGDVTDAWTSIGVQGAAAARVVGRAFAGLAGPAAVPADLADWSPYRNQRFAAGDDVVMAARVDDFGMPGFYFYGAPGLVDRLRESVLAAGAEPIGEDTSEVLRIEAGVPRFHVDMTGETIPLEAAIEQRAISSTKGCYPGQEVVIRILHRGQGRVLRKLTGLTLDGEIVPSAGDRLMAGDKQIGHATSACHSPALGRPIALGYVHRDFLVPGTDISVAHGESLLAAKVTDLPFVR
jgi:folate-binding protein YgfZ